MAILKIQTGVKNKILRAKSKAVGAVSKKILKFAADMIDTLKGEEGLGLAAPQVGENVRVIIVKIEKSHVVMVNPEITMKSFETEIREEGCLSLPKQYYDIERSKEITVKFVDLKGKRQTLNLLDLSARVVQHETDHLDGILMTDYLKK